jgi:hypothetical protein
MPDILNPTVSVRKVYGWPDFAFAPVHDQPSLEITVTYDAVFSGLERQLPNCHFGYHEYILLKGTIAQLSSEAIDVPDAPGSITVPRQVTRLVAMSFLHRYFGVLNAIPIQCTITLRPSPNPEKSQDTNTITLPGARYRTTALVGRIAEAVFWIQDQLLGRYQPDSEGSPSVEGHGG